MKKLIHMRRLPWEAFIWLFALLTLAFYIPGSDTHFTLCPLHHLGVDFCPGCGLGKSLAYLLHGEVSQSLAAHPLGIFALIILSFRIFQLTQHYLKFYGKNN